MECHLPYGITHYHLPLLQVNTLRLDPSQRGWYSIHLPWKDGRLNWPHHGLYA